MTENNYVQKLFLIKFDGVQSSCLNQYIKTSIKIIGMFSGY